MANSPTLSLWFEVYVTVELDNPADPTADDFARIESAKAAALAALKLDPAHAQETWDRAQASMPPRTEFDFGEWSEADQVQYDHYDHTTGDEEEAG